METYTEKVLWIQLCPLGYLGLLKVKALVTKSCRMLCDPVDCSSPGSSDHGILQAKILEWVAISFSRESSWPRDQTPSPTSWADSLPSEPLGEAPEVPAEFPQDVSPSKFLWEKKHLNEWSCYVIWRVSTFIKTIVSQIGAFDLPFSSQPEDGVLKLALVLYCDTCVTMIHKTPTVFGQVAFNKWQQFFKVLALSSEVQHCGKWRNSMQDGNMEEATRGKKFPNKADGHSVHWLHSLTSA